MRREDSENVSSKPFDNYLHLYMMNSCLFLLLMTTAKKISCWSHSIMRLLDQKKKSLQNYETSVHWTMDKLSTFWQSFRVWATGGSSTILWSDDSSIFKRFIVYHVNKYAADNANLCIWWLELFDTSYGSVVTQWI